MASNNIVSDQSEKLRQQPCACLSNTSGFLTSAATKIASQYTATLLVNFKLRPLLRLLRQRNVLLGGSQRPTFERHPRPGRSARTGDRRGARCRTQGDVRASAALPAAARARSSQDVVLGVTSQRLLHPCPLGLFVL